MVCAIDKILRRYGNLLILKRGEVQIPFRGFLQHSGSKSLQNTEHAFCPLGQIPRGQYVLIAPMEPEMAVGDTLILGALTAVIRRIETVTVGDKQVYRWGLCVEKGGEDTWAMQS